MYSHQRPCASDQHGLTLWTKASQERKREREGEGAMVPDGVSMRLTSKKLVQLIGHSRISNTQAGPDEPGTAHYSQH